MSVQEEKVPPVPQLIPPLRDTSNQQDLRSYRFENAWMQWFTQVKFKIDVINANLFSISNLSGAGFTSRAADGTWNQREFLGVTARITVTNGTGELGNPVIDIASDYVGQTSITTLGTVTTGTWNATIIAAQYGGTGIGAYTANNYIRAASATTLEQRTPAQVLSDIGASPALTTTSTSATGGSATALPAQPVGYVEVQVGGVTKKIAYYDP